MLCTFVQLSVSYRRRGDEKIRFEGYPVEAHEKGKKPTLVLDDDDGHCGFIFYNKLLDACAYECVHYIVTRQFRGRRFSIVIGLT